MNYEFSTLKGGNTREVRYTWKFRNNTVKHLLEKMVILFLKVKKQKTPYRFINRGFSSSESRE